MIREPVPDCKSSPLAIPLVFASPWIASSLFVFVALMWLVPDHRIERVLVKREENARTQSANSLNSAARLG
jgi:hypothetical protein